MSPVITRRDFARTVGFAVAATSVASSAIASASPSQTHTSFAGGVKQIDAGVLNVGYVEVGPADGPPVILLHGWPYDIYSYVDVAPILAARGYRVLIPYLRGYGSTRFNSADAVRNGQQAALAQDAVDFMDALNIDRAVLAGFDWGARTADIVAAVWPERVKALVSVSGYLIVNLVANQQPLSPKAERGWWYQYYFATDRGVQGYRQNTHDFNKLIWQEVSPTWKFDDATYDRTTSTASWPSARRSPCRQSPSAATSTGPTRTVPPTARCSPVLTPTASSTALGTTSRRKRRRRSPMRSSPPRSSN
jgi:pimeloyl-ACP methyl ester carboxylesterase